MLKQYEYNGYIGEAELSKNRKKNKSTIFFNIFGEYTTWRHPDGYCTGLHVEFSKKKLKKMYFCFFYGALFLMKKPMFQLERPKMTTK